MCLSFAPAFLPGPGVGKDYCGDGEGGSGGFDPSPYGMDVTAYSMYCGKNAQEHAEAWAASHSFRALALPTRCVAIK